MKTSVMEVRDMLSVLSVPGVENGLARCPESKALQSITLPETPRCATTKPALISPISSPAFAKTDMRLPRPPPLRRATVTKATHHRARRLQPPHLLRRNQPRTQLPRARLPQETDKRTMGRQGRLDQPRYLLRNLRPRPCPLRQNQPRPPLRPRAPLLKVTNKKTKRRRPKVRTPFERCYD